MLAATRTLPVFLVFAAITVLLYSNTFSHDYALDDEAVIEFNTHVHMGLAGLPTIFSSGYWSGAGSFQNGYRPLSVASYALEYHFFGLNPAVSHVVNVALYAIPIMMLLSVLRQFDSSMAMRHGSASGGRSLSRYWPYITVLIFAVHPVHTEVVAKIKSRDEILAFLFCI